MINKGIYYPRDSEDAYKGYTILIIQKREREREREKRALTQEYEMMW